MRYAELADAIEKWLEETVFIGQLRYVWAPAAPP
jgi:hypothetical protein